MFDYSSVGRRIIVSKGWAELELIDDAPDCIAIGNVSYDLLLPRIAAVVHHGGAGAPQQRTNRRSYRVHASLSRTVGYRFSPRAGCVHPDLQRRGFGTALISETLLAPSIAGSPVFVVGDPKYYARFGVQRVVNPSCPFDPGNQHFQALRWASDDVFTVGYEPQFHAA